ncbi:MULTISPECIES: hypothetical protein [Streptomyces]|uniref:Uncharacterized protein n=1 Tax=Streptomyces stelliscabiei TaxID=146820 RepID=A0A8I0TNH2_9ACTN|nr:MULTISPECIES: hypothetical protein [Streptomyces]KFG10123.1 hypothetical protein IQ61_04420 [Streptomyces scabiei]KND26303.1 hypothetical protein IQ64_46615 [Streptomyces stelliscabiei]MBE1594232.1 hypothetical protein [Streptomyces stelliscabiei]
MPSRLHIAAQRDERGMRVRVLEQSGAFGERLEVPVLVPRLGDTVGMQQQLLVLCEPHLAGPRPGVTVRARAAQETAVRGIRRCRAFPKGHHIAQT